jgi:hypothetical protein
MGQRAKCLPDRQGDKNQGKGSQKHNMEEGGARVDLQMSPPHGRLGKSHV